VHRFLLAAPRVLATIVISGIAAWVSYWHMAGVTARYGETGASPYLLPISVDGLIVVASVSLVELAARIRTLEDPPPTTAAPSTVAATARASAVDSGGAGTISVPVPTTEPVDEPAEPVMSFDDEDQAVTADLIDRARTIVTDNLSPYGTTGRAASLTPAPDGCCPPGLRPWHNSTTSWTRTRIGNPST
jgi:hypothetical protein